MLISYCDIHKQIIELELPPRGGIIGYDGSCFIVIDSIGVSAMHVRLTAVGDRLFIEDLRSLNGTYLNRSLLLEKTELQSGDSILIGLTSLCFVKNEDSWSLTTIRQDSSHFIVDRSKSASAASEEEENSTAVTVIASNEVKEAVRSGDFSKLQQTPSDLLPDPPQKNNFSLDSLQELGAYRVIKKIGKGGMGTVFLAKHKVMNNYRALKVLPHSVKEDNYDFFERFMREARIASEIRHPNIIGVMDAETDNRQHLSFIVMEFIDGGTLRRILKIRKKLPEIQALLIVKGIAEALKAISQHKIVHRDIKPDNIMFTRHGDVKLADLGIAKNIEEDVNLTKNDMMIGTPAYLSPEQIEDPQSVDIRGDIYSLGATLYEMLTETTPYKGKNTLDILQKMVSESIVDPRKKNPDISAVTAKIVMKMLHRNPAKRYHSPQALLDDLNKVLPRYSVSVVQSIIRSAVLGTEMPEGVNTKISSGTGATLNFLFFSCCRKIAEFFTVAEQRKSKSEDGAAASGRYFSFQIDSLPDKTVDFKISAFAGRRYKLLSADSFAGELKSSAEGELEIKNLPPGKYRIILENENN